jgi:hypothetical protein
MDVPEVRRRVRGAIASARSAAQERRARVDVAARDYETFLVERAVPVFHTFASALVAEGHRFKVFTPAGSVRLASEGGTEDFIELALDSTGDRPEVMGRSNRGRGRRQVTSERPIKEGAEVASLTDEDVLNFLAEEIGRLVE